MVPIIIWLAAIVLLIIGEAMTVGLTLIWFAVGAVGGLIAAAFGAGTLVQLVVFLVVSALALLLVRPVAKQHLQNKLTPTNADRVIGKTALVTEPIDNVEGKGQVSIAGQVWTARSEHNELLPVNTEVRVLRIEGVKVFVEAV